MNEETIVIDASNWPAGRIASYAAKQSLFGKKVIIVNCDSAVLTGSKRSVIREYKEIRNKGGAIMKGPFFPRTAEKIMKRTVRGMLNYHQQRGMNALKRISCHKGVPEKYKESKKISLASKGRQISITLSELSKEI